GGAGRTGSARAGGDRCGPGARARRSPTLRAGDSSEARSRLLVVDEIPAVRLLNGAFLQWLSFEGPFHRHRATVYSRTISCEVQRPWGKEVRRSLDIPSRGASRLVCQLGVREVETL